MEKSDAIAKPDGTMQKHILVVSILLLNACSTIPKGPSVLTLPGTGKELKQFHSDDWQCRDFARAQVSAPKEPDTVYEGQQNYDMNYIQCMYSKGHRVPVSGNFSYKSQKDSNFIPPPANMPAPPDSKSPELPTPK